MLNDGDNEDLNFECTGFWLHCLFSCSGMLHYPLGYCLACCSNGMCLTWLLRHSVNELTQVLELFKKQSSPFQLGVVLP